MRMLAAMLVATTMLVTAHAGTAVLKIPTTFPVIVQGKTAGSVKLPAGTKVEVLQRAGDKALVKASIGEAWVPTEHIELNGQLPQPANAEAGASPAPQTPPRAAREAAPETTTAAATSEPAKPNLISEAETASLRGRSPAELEALATDGNVAAQFLLGNAYRDGEGTPKHIEAAIKWYRMAAENGASEADVALGDLYCLGITNAAPVDWENPAAAWKQQAAAGDVDAQVKLGSMCYRNGFGVPKDPAKAIYWLEKAAAQNNAMAMYKLGKVYSGDRPEAPKDPDKSLDLMLKAAERGNSEAQNDLPSVYAAASNSGREKALAWAQNGAGKGTPAAAAILKVATKGVEAREEQEIQVLDFLKKTQNDTMDLTEGRGTGDPRNKASAIQMEFTSSGGKASRSYEMAYVMLPIRDTRDRESVMHTVRMTYLPGREGVAGITLILQGVGRLLVEQNTRFKQTNRTINVSWKPVEGRDANGRDVYSEKTVELAKAPCDSGPTTAGVTLEVSLDYPRDSVQINGGGVSITLAPGEAGVPAWGRLRPTDGLLVVKGDTVLQSATVTRR